MRCDTCHREVPEVSRVVVYIGYNRMSAKAMYNCPECFARKEKGKPYARPIEEAPLRGTSLDGNLKEAASGAASEESR